MKKLIYGAILVLIALSVCALGIFVIATDETVIYVSGAGADTNIGVSAAEPKATLAAAVAAIGDGDGRIIVSGDLTVGGGQGVMPAHSGRITYTSEGYGATVRMGDSIYFGGESVIENIKFHYPSGAKHMYCQGYNTVFGEGIEVTFEGDDAPSIYGGKNSNASGASAEELALGGFALQVDSGIWNKVYCGNYRKNATDPLGTITGNTTLTLNGGKFLEGVSATGFENRVGNATLTINGGELLCSVYGISEPCNDFGYQLSFVGNIDINANGGMYAGDIAVALRDGEAAFEGTCNINLNGGDFSRVNMICGAESTALYSEGKAYAYLNIGDGVDIRAEQSGSVEFESNFADLTTSSVYYHEGWYYYTYSSTYKTRTALWIKRAANFADLKNARPQLAWANALTPTNIKSLKLPQLVFIDGSFYIYASCGYESNSEIRCPTVFTANTCDNPLDGFTYFGPMQGLDSNVYSYMSFGFAEHNGKNYLITSGFFRAEDRVLGSKHYQSLFVTEMESPTALTGTASKIAESTYSWEMSNSNKCKILEKPFVYTGADGKLYILYSSSEAAKLDYCSGYLRFDGEASSNIKDASLWYKSPEPFHRRDTSLAVNAPGGVVLVPSPDGESMWLLYTARTTSDSYITSGRYIYAQPFETDSNGAPASMTPCSPDTALSYNKNSMPLSERIEGFDNHLIYVSASGADTNRGTTPDSPKKTIAAAIKAIGAGEGKIIICGNIAIESGVGTLSSYRGRITISSAHAGRSYNGKLTVSEDIYFGGATVIENIELYYPEAKSIFCGGYNTVFGEGIVVSYDGYTPPSIYGGKNASLSGQSLSNLALVPFTLQIDSGIWNKVYCGNYRNTAATTEPLVTLRGDTLLTINGGTFKGGVSATGNEKRAGNMYLTINGGEFLCSVYGIAEPCNEFGQRLVITGDIDITVNGGTFTGDICTAVRESETVFTGHCDIKLLSGDFSRVNLIRGAEGTVYYSRNKCTAYLTVGEGVDINAEQTGEIEFKNNIADFADPSVFYHEGWYYYTYSKTYKSKPALWIRRAANFSDISSARPVLVWAEAINSTGMNTLWAPQLAFMDGRYYIYATCDYKGTANEYGIEPRKPVVFVSDQANNALGGYTYHGPMDNVDPDVFMYLSPRFIEWNGKTYMINGGFFREEDRVPDVKHFQSLFITEMESPTAFKGTAHKIAWATESWEISNGGKCEILEGPFAYTGASDGKLYVLYSANETATENYCTGMLRFDGTATDDITDASLWYKFSEPIQQKDASLGIYSPGAAVLTPSPNGEEMWMIFHAKMAGGVYTYADRILFAQPFKVDSNGVPQKNELLPVSTVFSYEKNVMPLSERIEGFDQTIDLSIPPKVGDIDGDRVFTNTDITLLIRYLSGFTDEVTDTTRCDLDGNGKVNNRDAIELIIIVSKTTV